MISLLVMFEFVVDVFLIVVLEVVVGNVGGLSDVVWVVVVIVLEVVWCWFDVWLLVVWLVDVMFVICFGWLVVVLFLLMGLWLGDWWVFCEGRVEVWVDVCYLVYGCGVVMVLDFYVDFVCRILCLFIVVL